MQPRVQDPLLGKILADRFEMLDRIGEGGMGVVYRARQLSVDRLVAIKVLNAQVAQDPKWVGRFINEAKACSKLQHPNTVRLTVQRGDRESVMVGSSLGAGRVLVTEIDGYPVEVTGNYHTIVLVAEDVKGSVARIAGVLAEDDLNIATLRLTRKERGGDAFMVIEIDEAPGEHVRDHIRALPWVRWAFRLDKVSA